MNPNDVTGGIPKKLLDLHFEVKFDGINISLREKETEIVHTGVTGESRPGRVGGWVDGLILEYNPYCL